jgi:tetratricopeptide (TPR) repeat protein
VQVFDDHDEFMVRSVGLPGNPGHLGICFGNLVTLDSPRARPPRTMNWQSVLWHEFVHVITLQKTRNRIPRWLSEGISVYEETQRDPAWGQSPQPEFAALLDARAWPRVDDLEAYFVRPESPDHLMLGYFLAGEFVRAYVDAHGMSSLNRALDAIGTGDGATAALAAAADTDGDGLDHIFAERLALACKPLRYLTAPSIPPFFIPKIARPSFPDVLEKGLEAEDRDAFDEAIEYYEAAAALYPSFPGPENPLRRLAAIHRASGDLPAWSSAVARLCRHDPAAYEEPHAFLMAALERAAWDDVMAYARWCLAIDPFDISVHQALRRAQDGVGNSEEALQTLGVLAVLDGERSAEYRLAAARLHLSLGRRDVARRTVLEVLEAYPAYREAQLVLLSLHDGGTEEESADAS